MTIIEYYGFSKQTLYWRVGALVVLAGVVFFLTDYLKIGEIGWLISGLLFGGGMVCLEIAQQSPKLILAK